MFTVSSLFLLEGNECAKTAVITGLGPLGHSFMVPDSEKAAMVLVVTIRDCIDEVSDFELKEDKDHR